MPIRETLKFLVGILSTAIIATGFILLVGVLSQFIPKDLGIGFQFLIGLFLIVLGMVISGIVKREVKI